MADGGVPSKKLSGLIGRLRGLANGQFKRKLAKAMAAEALSQTKLGFRQSRDPYGKAWASLKHRRGKQLLDTGRLRNSFSASATDDGFRVGSNVEYAFFHQLGTRTIEARPMLPNRSDVGPIWSGAFRKTFDRVFSRHMKS